MSFLGHFNQLAEQGEKSPLLRRFEQMIAPMDDGKLEALARQSQAVTRRHFGRTMRLFAPLYVSNECVNICKYCGFSRDNTDILRVTLSVDEVVRETRRLAEDGFRNVLLVAGEHPKFVSSGYLEECVRAILPIAPSVAIEVGPMEENEYVSIVEAGAETLIVYQETYDRELYAQLHSAGPKKDFDWRLDALERGYAAGFRRLQAGALLGLSDWRLEALSLAAHVEHLLKTCWRAFISISLPRLRPCAGEFQPLTSVSDRDFVQLVCAFRIAFPQIGITLSTRESPALRDALLPLGVTMMSAGSHTDPGGYTGQGRANLHRTVRGRQVEADDLNEDSQATGQFEIADSRSPTEIVRVLRKNGLEPVWKDWDQALAQNAA